LQTSIRIKVSNYKKVNTVVSNVNVEQLLQRLCLVLKSK
jgi:hypothetical protein